MGAMCSPRYGGRVPPALRKNMNQVDVTWPDRDKPAKTFAARCQPMAELYTLQLRAGEPLKAASSWTRIWVASEPFGPGDGPWVHAEAFTDGESIHCVPNLAILAAPRSDWSLLYLLWLHEHLLALADVRGWETAPLFSAYQGCLDADLTVRLTSPGRLSPTRQHLAKLHLTVDIDGRWHFTLTVADRAGNEVSSTTQSRTGGQGAAEQFRRMSRQLRWETPSTVVADDRWRVGDLPWHPGHSSLQLTVPEGPSSK
jgi:hypothetical protein